MKTTPVCSILATILAISSSVHAEDPRPGREGNRPGHKPGRGVEMWKKVDQDQDGSISPDEFFQMPRLSKLPDDKRQALFDRLDKNGDGGIDRTEMHQGNDRPDQGRPVMPNIWELDKDQDGGVSFEEMLQGRMFQRLDPEKQNRMFKHLDSNGDGKITTADKPKRRPRPEGGGERPRPGGENRPRPDGEDRPRPDGGQGKPERPQIGGLVERLDKNGDGSVSPEEFAASPRIQELDEETQRKRFQMMDRNGDGKLDRSDLMRKEGQRPRPRPGGPSKPERGAAIE